MSDTFRLVELAWDDSGATLAHVEAWGPVSTATMETIPADGQDVAFLTLGVDSDTVANVRADIASRAAAGQTPVLKSHLDTLGITAAVQEWATQ